MDNIKKNYSSDLCTGCGTCAGMCPNSAIKIVKNKSKGIYVPEVDDEKCTQCGICLEVCPGHSVDFNKLNKFVFQKISKDVFLGNYLNCCIGHSTNEEIRYNSASGGLVTQLLIFALEEGVIDGALVTRMNNDKPLEPEPFIARTKEEIIEASKSKYCPVPVNIELKEILNSEDGEKFAVVGLPCHINGIRKAEILNKKLREKIILHLGLFCSRTPNFLGTEFLFRKFNIKKEDVRKVSYRGEGWPGNMLIEFKNGSKKNIPYLKYWNSGFRFFFSLRCSLCYDKLCELADISFGDAGLSELMDNKIGESMIISRNKKSENLLQNAMLMKKIELNRIDRTEIMRSLKTPLRFKKNNLKARIFFAKIFGWEVPDFNQKLLEPKFDAYLEAMLVYLLMYMSSKRYLWNILDAFDFLIKCKHKIRK